LRSNIPPVQNSISASSLQHLGGVGTPQTTYPQHNPQQLWASRFVPDKKLEKTVTYSNGHVPAMTGYLLTNCMEPTDLKALKG
jgi:hypothetical protein